MRVRAIWVGWGMLGLMGCGDSETTAEAQGAGGTSDAGQDAAQFDVLADSVQDTQADAHTDAADTSAEAEFDAQPDTAVDSAPLPDGAAETSEDAPIVDADAGASEWMISLIDSTPAYKSRAAVAVGADGYPQLAYNVATSEDGWFRPAVWYAKFAGGVWSTSLVADANGISNEFPIIVVDAQNVPHIFYNRYDPDLDEIDIQMVSGDTGGHFAPPVNVTVSTNMDAYGSAAALDRLGRIHLLYAQTNSETGLGYSTIDAGQSSESELMATNVSQFSLSPDYGIDVDDDGVVHVVYCRPGALDLNNVLYYRTRTDEGWQEEEALTEQDLDVWAPSIGVDSQGVVHVAYAKSPDWNEKTLRYRRRVGGVWQAEQTLTSSTDDRSYYLGLQVQPRGVVHLGFYRYHPWGEQNFGDIYFLGGMDGTFRAEERITNTADMDEEFPSVAIGPGGETYVAFVENLSDAPNGKLFLAARR